MANEEIKMHKSNTGKMSAELTKAGGRIFRSESH
jgi:hypothetical protein